MRARLTHLGIYGFLVLVAVITLYPLLWVVGLALGDGQRRGGLNPFQSAPTLDGFQTLFSHSGFSQALFNSLVISLAAASLGVLLAATLGYALSRFDYFGKEAGLKAIIVSQMFPGVVSSIPIYWLLHHLACATMMLSINMRPRRCPFVPMRPRGGSTPCPGTCWTRLEWTERGLGGLFGRWLCLWRRRPWPSPFSLRSWARGVSLFSRKPSFLRKATTLSRWCCNATRTRTALTGVPSQPGR